ncbi:MAG: uL22 family ribosomal protein [Deltaproteobacteria bacterium]|nr:uL22 family ribosomal protein [Deltaproteobacteria bacterium]MCX7952528.1 uL22 family ribosomal protein [Deltaproteobacteria bacterium]
MSWVREQNKKINLTDEGLPLLSNMVVAKRKSGARVLPWEEKGTGNRIYPEYTYVTLRNAKVSPRKIRPILNAIRGCNLQVALAKLATCKRKGARILEKMINQLQYEAMTKGFIASRFRIVGCWANMGIRLKRFMPAAHGRVVGIQKRYSHITIVGG